MPYKIKPEGDKFQVVNSETGKVMGTHPTEEKAKAQLAALEINVEDAGKSIGELLAAKMGRRNNALDQGTIQEIHDLTCKLGAECMETVYTEDWEFPESAFLNYTYAKSLGIKFPDLAVKRIGTDDIQFYSNLWGNPDKVDLEQEYFKADTDFWDNVLPDVKSAPRPLTWDHAQDPATKADPVIGKIVEMGDDKVGRWMIAKLNRAHEYRKAIDGLIEKKAIGASSDSAPQYVMREKVGKSIWLKRWPLFAVALTEVPCEPRMVGMPYFKSIGLNIPDATPDELRIKKGQRLFETLKNLYGV